MPQAELAGLPPITGLYTSIMCLLGSAVLGLSRILELGPDSSLGPMIAATILPLIGDGGDGKREMARGPIGRQRVPRAAPPPVRCQVRLALQVAPAAELRGFPIRRRRRQLSHLYGGGATRCMWISSSLRPVIRCRSPARAA